MPRVYFYSSLLRSRAEIFSEKFTNRAPHVERNNRYIAEQCSEKPMTASAWIENCSARRTQSTPLRATLASHCTWPQWRHKRVRRPWGRSSTRRSVPKPADGARGRSDGNHVSTLVSSPSWCVSSAAGSSDNHARVALFSLPLSLSLFFPPSLSLSLSSPPSPSSLSLSLSLSSFSYPVPARPSPFTDFLFLARETPVVIPRGAGGPTDRVARGVCVQPEQERERGGGRASTPLRELCYRTARPVSCARLELCRGVGEGGEGVSGGGVLASEEGPTDRPPWPIYDRERQEGRRCNAAQGWTCWLRAAVTPVRGDAKRKRVQRTPPIALPRATFSSLHSPPPSLSLSLSLSLFLFACACILREEEGCLWGSRELANCPELQLQLRGGQFSRLVNFVRTSVRTDVRVFFLGGSIVEV